MSASSYASCDRLVVRQSCKLKKKSDPFIVGLAASHIAEIVCILLSFGSFGAGGSAEQLGECHQYTIWIHDWSELGSAVVFGIGIGVGIIRVGRKLCMHGVSEFIAFAP